MSACVQKVCYNPCLFVIVIASACNMYAESVGVPRGYTSEAPWPQLTGSDGLGGCPHCFCNPCVISMPPDFLAGCGPPHLRNVEKRYTLYRKFWWMLTDMKLWGHPVYLSKKQAITSLLDQQEILPKCVMKVTFMSFWYCSVQDYFSGYMNATPTHQIYPTWATYLLQDWSILCWMSRHSHLIILRHITHHIIIIILVHVISIILQVRLIPFPLLLLFSFT